MTGPEPVPDPGRSEHERTARALSLGVLLGVVLLLLAHRRPNDDARGR